MNSILNSSVSKTSNFTFEIISNNCWGAEIYKELNSVYNTPFVGLFVPPACYIKLLSNLYKHLQSELAFISNSKYLIYNQFRESSNNYYPIGLLGNEIEIHFQHYRSEQEASEKWSRRLARMTLEKERLFIKFCDRELNSVDEIKLFDKLTFPHKVCFTSKRYSNLKSVVYINECGTLAQVVDGKALYSISKNYFNVIRWIQKGSGKLSLVEEYKLCIRLCKRQLTKIKNKLTQL